MTESYAESVGRETRLKAREREAFRDASRLWYVLLDADGFSYRPGRQTPRAGFMVGQSYEVPTEILRTCTVERLYRFFLTHWDLFADPDVYLGAWLKDGR